MNEDYCFACGDVIIHNTHFENTLNSIIDGHATGEIVATSTSKFKSKKFSIFVCDECIERELVIPNPD